MAAGRPSRGALRRLLERTPDSTGVNSYLPQIAGGRHREAVMSLIRSGEFEASLPSR
ncbi:MAG TPA: DUF4214 domain-containing protein [Acidobacteria bacterium]|nr:DUF4214 domain-containing protein [Acidobacteriota bacterium]